MTSSAGSSPYLRHPERDPDLLRLAHRGLPPVTAALTRLHLIRCADCRRRLGDLRTASYALAAAARGPEMPPWSLPRRTPFGGGVAVWTLLAATVLLGIGLVALIVHVHRQPPAAPRIGGPCRPDLPSDRCR